MPVALRHAGPDASQPPSARRPVARRMRRLGLGIFFVSVAANATLGIYAVLAPNFGETQGKILATSLCVTGAVLLALACEPAWERGLLGLVPYAGAILGAVGFTLAIGAIWTEPESGAWGRAMGSIFGFAVACVFASLLALAPLVPRRAWIFKVTLVLLGLGAAMYSVLMWLGDDPPDEYLRAFGVVMIVLAAFVVSVPVLHWVDRGALAAAESATGSIRFCPYCGKKLSGEISVDLECAECGRGFSIASIPQST